MSKKKPPSTSAGTTVNPVAQPTAPAPAASAAPAPARAKAKTTAGPAETPATDAADFEQEATAFLAESINIGSDAEDLQLDAALAGQARRGQPNAADTTPVDEDDTAEDQTSGEETAATEATGDTPEQDDSADTDETDDSETDPKADTRTEAETEADDEAVKWPKSYLRRINKLTEKIERLEEQATEAEQLREENERLKANPAPEPLGHAPGAVTTEEQTLQQQLAKVEETLDFIEANPEGATIGDRQWTPEELRQQKRAYERKMREIEAGLVDAKRKRAERAEALGQKLVERHPWMKDRKSPGHARVEEIVRMYPAFRDIPEARTMIADHLAFQGLLDRMARQQAAGNGNGNGHAANGKPAANGNGHKPAPPPPRPPAARGPGKPGATPMPVNGRRASLQKAESTFLETGDHEAGKTLISSLLSDD